MDVGDTADSEVCATRAIHAGLMQPCRSALLFGYGGMKDDQALVFLAG